MSISGELTKNRFHELADGRIGEAVYDELERTGERITEYARQIVPVDTGELLESIGDEGNGRDEVINYAEAEHAAYVELGTRNMAAQPYMVPAFVAETANIEERVAGAVRSAIGG